MLNITTHKIHKALVAIQYCTLCILLVVQPNGIAQTLHGVYDVSPPDFIFDFRKNKVSGPAKEIIEEATKKLGYSITWSEANIHGTSKPKQTNPLDLIAQKYQLSHSKSGTLPVLFGFEDKTVYLLVKKGYASKIKDYDDLKHHKVLIKTGKNYFAKLDTDKQIEKINLANDEDLVQAFTEKESAVLVTDDLLLTQVYLNKISFNNWEFADYFYPQIAGRYYHIPKTSEHAYLHKDISCALFNMRKNGRVNDIYDSFELEPPLQLFDHRDSVAQQILCEDTFQRSANR